MNKPEFIIKENSRLAKIAAIKLGSKSVAMVLGKTIHLHNTTKANFLQDERWVKHELCHIKQFKDHGYVGFIIKYLWESIKKGYYNNRFEVEARKAEDL
ncbi:MAG: DUF4157 domain-containing protein [Chitinophagaceae bacterium]|nr:DUF4157 domain-containing protein [Chitinophagaceae bacterium]MBK8785746.1 DUF4157 domain-containing protein [Chitinophagaceae bacterium]MBK9487233.1 DUF4157 domain-containing protein [Chitinophagaceae bacterium]MBL0199623.1 DUF4157 domain-containing protein [Chitinophagaceae bacterium]